MPQVKMLEAFFFKINFRKTEVILSIMHKPFYALPSNTYV
jgi:hypothetical protein